MTQPSKFLIIWLVVLLFLAACSSSEGNLTTEVAENAEGKEEEIDSGPTDQPASTSTSKPTDIPSPTPETLKANFPNLGVAPEIENEVWLNADEPVTLASQKGKVVLVEFWTFG